VFADRKDIDFVRVVVDVVYQAPRAAPAREIRRARAGQTAVLFRKLIRIRSHSLQQLRERRYEVRVIEAPTLHVNDDGALEPNVPFAVVQRC